MTNDDKPRGKWRDRDPADGGLDPWKVPQEPLPNHRILRAVYRNYSQFRLLFADTGTHTLTHTYEWFEPDTAAEPNEKGRYPADLTKPQKETFEVDLFDLTEGLDELAKRKRQAFVLNVIEDRLQKEVGAIMGISTVTVGQYVDQACFQLAEKHLWTRKAE